MNHNEALKAANSLGLALDDNLTMDHVKAIYRDLVKLHHPDKGGDMKRFVEIDRAKCVLELWFKRQPPEDTTFKLEKCAICNGIGRVTIRRGFASMTIVCGRCRGSGDAQYEADISGE